MPKQFTSWIGRTIRVLLLLATSICCGCSTGESYTPVQAAKPIDPIPLPAASTETRDNVAPEATPSASANQHHTTAVNSAPLPLIGPEVPPPAEDHLAEVQVFVSKTGTKYHRAGCRHLKKSAIAITLAEATARHEPCRVCNPPE